MNHKHTGAAGRATSRSIPRHLTPLTFLVVANAVSLTGNVIATVAVPWLVLTTTGSAALTGLAVFAGAGAAAIGGLLAGRIVDAIGPVRTSAVADLLSGLAVAPLPILLAFDALEIWHVVLLAIAGTLADSAGSTARQSLVPAAADDCGYARERANAMFTSAEHIGYLLGAPIGGVLIAAIGVGGAMWVTVGAFLVAAVLVGIFVRVPAPRAAVAGAPRAGLADAIRFIWADPALRALVVFPTVATLLIGPLVPIVLPVMAREAFGDALALGLMVASYGAGGLLGAAAFGFIGRRLRRRFIFAGVFSIWPAIYVTLATLPPLAVAIPALLSMGVLSGSLVPMMATIRQERSPAHLLAWVVGLSTASVPVVGPIAVLVVGVLLEALGVSTTLLLMTAGTAMIGIAALSSAGVRYFDAAGSADVPAPVGTVSAATG
ncbi:MAG TPA: MFS transporter [Candidatus Limnocylindria bacterium]